MDDDRLTTPNLWPQADLKESWKQAQADDPILGPRAKFVTTGQTDFMDLRTPKYYLRSKHVEYVIRDDALLYLILKDSS